MSLDDGMESISDLLRIIKMPASGQNSPSYFHTLDKPKTTGHIRRMPKPNHRNKILSAGLAVFHERGFHGSGIQDVVDHAGVPKGSFYNHFKSKDALGLEVLECYWESNAENRTELRDSEIPALTRIDRHLAAAGYDKNGCLIGNFSGELAGSDAFRPRLSKLYKTWMSDVAACILDGQKNGTIRNDDSAENFAEFVIEGLEGAKLKAKVDRDPDVLERYRKSIRLLLENR